MKTVLIFAIGFVGVIVVLILCLLHTTGEKYNSGEHTIAGNGEPKINLETLYLYFNKNDEQDCDNDNDNDNCNSDNN